MFGNIILVMSLCGSIAFIGYLLLHPLIERYCSLRWNYRFLKIIILCYLLPIPHYLLELKYWIQIHFGIVLSDSAIEALDTALKNDTYILVQKENIQVTQRVLWTWITFAAIALCTFFILYWQMQRYLKLKKSYLECAQTEIPVHLQKHFSDLQEQVGVKKVNFVFSHNCSSPIAMGTISPMIILPYTMLDIAWGKDYKFMLLHELHHIKNHDLWIRFCTLAVIALHWFNPFCYLLFFEICNVSEFYCDFCTLNGEDEGSKKQYSHLILDMAAEHGSLKRPQYVVSLITDNKKFMIRRIQNIKCSRPQKHWVSCLLAVMLGMLSSAAALTYETPIVIDNTNGEQTIDLETTEIWTEEQAAKYDFSFVCPYADTLVYADGTMADFSPYAAAQDPNIICSHDYEAAERRIHVKDSSGGCTTTFWDIQFCRKCGSYLSGDLTQEARYKKCIH